MRVSGSLELALPFSRRSILQPSRSLGLSSFLLAKCMEGKYPTVASSHMPITDCKCLLNVEMGWWLTAYLLKTSNSYLTRCCSFFPSQLTRETTKILLEVAGQTDEVCKDIIRALLGWLLQYARPKVDECSSPPPLTIFPLVIENAETGDRLARYPTATDIVRPDFLNVKVG